MSAFLVTNAHLDYLACFACRGGQQYRQRIDWSNSMLTDRQRSDLIEAGVGEGGVLDFLDRQLVGRILWLENIRSLRARYGDDWNRGEPVALYLYRGVTVDWTVPRVLMALRCYEYQACESADYRESLADRVVTIMQKDAIHILTRDEPWCLEEEHVRPTREQLRAQAGLATELVRREVQGA
jgi:hypothetical protein